MTTAIPPTASVTFLRDTRHGGDLEQPMQVARMLADFIAAATTTVDVAIYDFRLEGELATVVVEALTGAAARGVVVRIAFDQGKPGDATAQTFAVLQGDPAPEGTAQWVLDHFGGSQVQTKGIAAAPQLMHSKYVIRDGAAAAAAVWTGSTNFTDDAWTLQENNIVVVTSAQVAAAYLVDFQAMWQASRITGTGAGDGGSESTDSLSIQWDFAPGDGPAIESALVDLIDRATSRIIVGAMVLTSHPLLAALAAAVTRGVNVSGIYDAGQMDPIVQTWKSIPKDAAVVKNWELISSRLSAKQSTPYTPTSQHDFMHNKVLVCDGTVATGSYNFSANAQRNAENQLRLTDAATTAAYVSYIAAIAAAYAGS